MSNLKRSILNLSGVFIYFFIQLVMSILITKFIGFEGSGINTIALTISNVFYPVALFGVRSFQVGDIQDKYSEGEYTYLRFVTTGASLAVFALSLCFLQLQPIAALCAAFYMITRVTESFADLMYGIFQKRDKFEYIFFSYFYKSLGVIITFVVTILITKNVVIVIAAQTVMMIVMFLCYDFRKYKNITIFSIQKDKVKSLLKQCVPIMLYSFIMPYINFVVRYYVQVLFGTTIQGYYSSIAIFQSVISTLTGCIWIVYIPMFAQIYGEGNIRILKKKIVQILGAIGLLTIVSVVATLLFGDRVLILIYKEKITSYTYLLLPIIIISIIISVVALFNAFLISIGKNKAMLCANAAGAVVITACAYPLVQKFELNGANYAMFAGVTIQLILIIAISWKTLKIPDIAKKNVV